MTAAEFFSAGNLSSAVTAALEEVKRQPAEVAPRWQLAELLCFAGDLERADKHLESLLTQNPKLLANVALFRSLLRGEQARREIAAQGRVPEFLTDPTPAARACLAALVALRSGDAAEAVRQVAAAERERTPLAGTCDGAAFADLRDLDDLFGPILEFITSDGNCGWLPLAHIATLHFATPARPRDLLWRPAEVATRDGQQKGMFVPALYVQTHRESSDALRLGRATDWHELAPGLSQGIGQRMWLIDDGARSLLEIKEIAFTAA